VYGDDVWMVQLCEGPGFTVEPLGERRPERALQWEDLQRDEAIERRLARLINGAHAAFAEESKDFELRKQPPDFFNSGR
jgi:hypothetical protein